MTIYLPIHQIPIISARVHVDHDKEIIDTTISLFFLALF
jgi:hypothetical protein